MTQRKTGRRLYIVHTLVRGRGNETRVSDKPIYAKSASAAKHQARRQRGVVGVSSVRTPEPFPGRYARRRGSSPG